MIRNRPAVLLCAVLCIAAFAAVVSYFVNQGTDKTPMEPLSLDDHLAAELLRLQDAKGRGTLSPSEQAVADALPTGTGVDQLKEQLVQEFGIAVTDRLREALRNDYRVRSISVIRVSGSPSAAGWHDFDLACAGAERYNSLIPDASQLAWKATADDVRAGRWNGFLASVAQLEERVVSASSQTAVRYNKAKPYEHLQSLPLLASLISARARLLALEGAEAPARGPTALWRLISILANDDIGWTKAKARAVAILLDQGGYQLFEARLLGKEDLTAYVNLEVRFPSLAGLLVDCAYQLPEELNHLRWLDSQTDREALAAELTRLHQAYGCLSLQGWIDAEFNARMARIEQLLSLASELDVTEAALQDPLRAGKLLRESDKRLEDPLVRECLSTWLLTRLQNFYLYALQLERIRLNRGRIDRSELDRILADQSHIKRARQGNTITIRLDPDHPLARFYPPECSTAQASFAVQD
ncbi:MAG: hypothetical protein ICCCNLDF_02697 [Planctomycetes bacterium]|nr:hypothetical protein [Planctomycetota bacterium]